MNFVAIAFLGIFLILLVLFIRRADLGSRFSLRPLSGYEALRTLLSRAAETGGPIHISVGTGGINTPQTAETLAGLETLQFLATRAAVGSIPPIVTVNDAAVLPLAQDQLRRAFTREGYPEEYDPRRVRLIAPAANKNNVPYAVGVMDVLAHENVFANVVVGSFGDEFLLIAEPPAQKATPQIGGTTSPEVLPFVYTSVEHPLLGEEIYAAGAYLSRKPAHLSSLLAQDTVRAVIVITLILGAILRMAGMI